MSSPEGNAQATILLVEDERALRSFVRSQLTKEDYTVITAVDGMDALEQAEKNNGSIDLLLSDVEMPRMTGVELATQFFQISPNTRILLMSGMPSGMLVLNERWQFLPKPFLADMLKAKIRHILKKTPEFPAGSGKEPGNRSRPPLPGVGEQK